MVVIFKIPLMKVIKSIINVRQLLMYLIFISLMLVLQSLQIFHMSMKVSMITLTRHVKNLFLMSATESEIVSVVNELCHKRSIDYIGLNMKIIKHVISNIAKPLC